MTNADTIRAMLQSVQDEREALKLREEKLNEREVTLLAWLKEEAGHSGMQANLSINGFSALGAFVAAALTPGKRFTAAQLGELARGRGLIADDVTHPGRAVHGALLGLQNQGHVKKNDDGTWSKQ